VQGRVRRALRLSKAPSSCGKMLWPT
jgi:hypothetical protein